MKTLWIIIWVSIFTGKEDNMPVERQTEHYTVRYSSTDAVAYRDDILERGIAGFYPKIYEARYCDEFNKEDISITTK